MTSQFSFFPESASESAGHTDAIFLAMLVFAVLFAGCIVAALVFFSIRYRAGSSASRAGRVHNSYLLESLWTAIPLVSLIAIYVWATRAFLHETSIPEDAENVYVVGKQWMWEFQHDSGRIERNELHVPVGRPVRLTMISRDVIHSLYLPALRLKHDVLPGTYSQMWFEADRTGEFPLRCAEYCGTDHSRMGERLVVMTPEDYARWSGGGELGGPAATLGRQVFSRLGCSGCHGERPTYEAPRLEGLFGRAVTLQSGESVLADEAYLRDSILFPNKQITAGYQPIMPSYQGQITEEEIFAVTAYIRSMPSAATEPSP